jgi:hypothetical protein
MTENEAFIKTGEILAKFKNSPEKYQKSALFHTIVQMMVRGVTEIEIIEYLIQVTEDTTMAFQNYANRDTRPIGFR